MPHFPASLSFSLSLSAPGCRLPWQGGQTQQDQEDTNTENKKMTFLADLYFFYNSLFASEIRSSYSCYAAVLSFPILIGHNKRREKETLKVCFAMCPRAAQ
jgi:hypothetical protein